ncbi:glycosyltransferase family 4 protein [Shewanella sp.]|uniref:glycosyltransferase family 4 protein n=1 Tax=Shewanella sp. TaxID=50422 RepID=UPI003A970897
MISSSIPQFTSLYAAFDRFPLPKGATTHIRQMASTLFNHCGDGLLYVAGDNGMPTIEHEQLSHAKVTMLRSPIVNDSNNVLAKAMAYAEQLAQLLQQRGQQLQIAHFRDPWAGVPLVDYQRQQPALKLVYEVNALPSIELPIHLPLPQSTIATIKHWEQRCLDGADIIITPSKLTQAKLQQRTDTPVHYLPNGADIISNEQQQRQLANQQSAQPRLIYFGGAQRWQGLHTLLQAMVIINRQLSVELDLCLSLDNRQARQLKQQIRKLGLEQVVKVFYGLTQAELRPKIMQATASIAPLVACQRNMQQGCCPLKIIESMACGTAVIASDLPVVHELLQTPDHGLFVPPSRPSELARACIRLVTQPQIAQQMGLNGLAHIAQHFQWATINQQLRQHYQQLLLSPTSLKRTHNESLASELA